MGKRIEILPKTLDSDPHEWIPAVLVFNDPSEPREPGALGQLMLNLSPVRRMTNVVGSAVVSGLGTYATLQAAETALRFGIDHPLGQAATGAAVIGMAMSLDATRYGLHLIVGRSRKHS